jgi:tetratricopeptide (TPR) repeat protein
VVIGDPLCAPFPGRAVARNELEPTVDPDTGLPTYFGMRRLANVRKAFPRVSPEVVTHLVRAEAFLAQGDFAAVRAALERATAADATLVGAELQLGALYEQAGLFDAAAKRYRKVLARNPDNVLALNNLAYLLAVRRGAAAEALPLAKKAHALAPRSASVIDTLAWVEHLRGQKKSAAILIAQAAELGPSNAEIQLHASAIYAAMGDRSRARAALKAALSLQPGLDTRDDVRTLKERLASGGSDLLQR